MIIKKSSKSKKPFIKFNHTRHFGFQIGKLPKRLCDVESNNPIHSWFNYKGLTFISEQNFINPITNKLTIE